MLVGGIVSAGAFWGRLWMKNSMADGGCRRKDAIFLSSFTDSNCLWVTLEGFGPERIWHAKHSERAIYHRLKSEEAKQWRDWGQNGVTEMRERRKWPMKVMNDIILHYGESSRKGMMSYTGRMTYKRRKGTDNDVQEKALLNQWILWKGQNSDWRSPMASCHRCGKTLPVW